MKTLQKYYSHALAFIGFVLVSLIYFYPVLQSKKIYQSDIVHYSAMAKEQNDFRVSENAEPYWTNSAFGGMPTYQLGAKYPNDFIGKLDHFLRFLPRPADYLFLYFLGFYVLLLVLKTDPLKAFFGALAFGFSTYLIVILGVGHNAKAHAIAYMPLAIAGIMLVFNKRFIVGAILTMLAVALEINANHPQMTYYLLFLIVIITVFYTYQFIKNNDIKSLFKVFGILAISGILAIGVNATSLLATAEYAKSSTRGKGELTISPEGTKKTDGATLDRNYITEYSYGVAESFNLIAPRLFGGANNESLSKESEIVSYLQKQQVSEGQYISEDQAIKYAAEGMPTYWGDQPIVAAPAYIGAVVFFLCVLGLYHDKRKIKFVFVAGAIFSLILSWGKNLAFVTDFFIDFVPMYDKFRAVSSIQVLLELCIPVVAIMGLQSFFTTDKEKQWESLWKATATVLGLLVALFLLKGMFSFSGASDAEIAKSYGPDFLDALKSDRRTLYSADLLRSGIFISFSFLFLYLFTKEKLAKNSTIILVGLLMVMDLFLVDKNYVSSKDFKNASEVDTPFQQNMADSLILQDKTVFRVFELAGGLTNSRASYYHHSIGGYSAVKPRKMQELFDYQIEKSMSNLGEIIDPKTLTITKEIPVLCALNVKYLIVSAENKEIPIVNPYHNGNAWFVSQLRKVNSADDEIKALGNLDTKNVAITQSEIGTENTFSKDSTATIQLTSYKPNHLKYTSNNSKVGFAVFSEMYYKEGWNATIDGKSTPILKVDYALRGINIPAGNHQIEFKFEPQVIKTGSLITLISFIGMILLIVGGIYFERKNIKF
jgi:hypothetical protein